jgi:hypothetical protein
MDVYLASTKDFKSNKVDVNAQNCTAKSCDLFCIVHCLDEPVISVSYDSRYESYDTLRFCRLAMRTVIVYWKIRVSVESSRYSSAIRVSYRIERYSDSVMTNGKSPHFVSYRFDSHRRHLPIASSYPSYRTKQIDREIEIDSEF